MALTDEEQERRRAAVRDLFPMTPFINFLGMVVEQFEPDDVVMRLPFRADLTNDGAVYHGGVVASALDTAGALAAWSNHDFDKGARASTVDMSIQFLGAAKSSDLLVHGHAGKRGRELIFTEISATDADGNLVARALQTYRIV
jgi:uncharacterized protein (TIGR00369 family)